MQLSFPFFILLLLPYLPGNRYTFAVPVISMEQLQEMIVRPGNDTLYVVNFWATWCKPCLEEMPYFQEASNKFGDKKIKIILVSLDFISESDRLRKFADKRKMREVYQLNAGNPNDWIDTIDSAWSGSIPATVFYRAGEKKYFREGEFRQAELDSIIQLKLQ